MPAFSPPPPPRPPLRPGTSSLRPSAHCVPWPGTGLGCSLLSTRWSPPVTLPPGHPLHWSPPITLPPSTSAPLGHPAPPTWDLEGVTAPPLEAGRSSPGARAPGSDPAPPLSSPGRGAGSGPVSPPLEPQAAHQQSGRQQQPQGRGQDWMRWHTGHGKQAVSVAWQPRRWAAWGRTRRRAGRREAGAENTQTLPCPLSQWSRPPGRSTSPPAREVWELFLAKTPETEEPALLLGTSSWGGS